MLFVTLLVTATVLVDTRDQKTQWVTCLPSSASQPCLLCFPFNLQMLTGHDYIQGNEFSVADVAVGCTL